jgi:hypothetical protein
MATVAIIFLVAAGSAKLLPRAKGGARKRRSCTCAGRTDAVTLATHLAAQHIALWRIMLKDQLRQAFIDQAKTGSPIL